MHNPITYTAHLSYVRTLLRSYRTRMDELKGDPDVRARCIRAGVMLTSLLEEVARLLPKDVQQQIEALIADERACWETPPPAQVCAAACPDDLSAIYGPAATHADYAIGDVVAFLNVMDTEPPQAEVGIVLYVCEPTDGPKEHLPLCYVVGRDVPGCAFPKPYFVTARHLLGIGSVAL